MLPRKHEFSRMLLKPETENEERETGNGKGGTGNREQGTGKEERGTCNGERGTSTGDGKKGRNLNLPASPIRNLITPFSVMFPYFQFPFPELVPSSQLPVARSHSSVQ